MISLLLDVLKNAIVEEGSFRRLNTQTAKTYEDKSRLTFVKMEWKLRRSSTWKGSSRKQLIPRIKKHLRDRPLSPNGALHVH